MGISYLGGVGELATIIGLGVNPGLGGFAVGCWSLVVFGEGPLPFLFLFFISLLLPIWGPRPNGRTGAVRGMISSDM